MHIIKNGSRLPANLLFGLGLVLVAALLSSGCKKATVAEPASAAAEIQPVADQAPVSNTVATAAPSPVVIAASPDGGADLKQLNHVYVGWIVSNRRSPKSFEEFVALSGITFPSPPAGKKYVIDKNGFINYANN